MTQNKYSALFAMGLLVFLFFPQWTKAETTFQAPDEFQLRNNETSGLKVNIKLFGGLSQLVGENDVNKYLDGWNQLLDDYAANSNGFGVSGEISPIGFSPAYGGELIFSFNPHLSIGVGAGYHRFSKQSIKTLTVEGQQIKFTMAPVINAIPLTLSLYYGIPIGNFLKLVVGAGAGYYLSQYKGSSMQANDDEEFKILFKSNKNTIGAHGSLDIEFNIGRTMALIFGVSGRYAVLKNLMGTESITYTNPEYTDTDELPDLTLWYLEDELFNGRYYVNFSNSEVKPEASYYRNVRKAEISLSSMTLQIGILFRLGQLSR